MSEGAMDLGAWVGWWPWLVLLTAALVTYLWRGIGVALSGHIRTDGALFEWVSAVAYALLAGLVARMIVQPLGPLQATPLVDRLASASVGLAVFLLTRHGRGILWGTAGGIVVLMALSWLRQGSA
jgi:branched-subunit amino acid transport protein